MATRVESASGVYEDGRVDGRRLAERLGVPHGTVKRWCTEPGFPVERYSKRIMIDVEAARAWVAERYPNTIAMHRESFVYFVRRHSDGAIKIGFSSDIERRLRELRKDTRSTVTLMLLVPGAKPEELATHARFAADLIGDEWFRPSDAILAFIAGRLAA